MELEEKKSRKKAKQIAFTLPDEWHTEIKVRASARNVSIKDWILQAIIQRVNQEKQYE